MLIIRNEQMEAFEQAAFENFQRGMVKHVREHFPKHVEVFGEETILNVIRHGCDRAKEYEFTTEHEVCLFIDLMIMLGSGFDTDPQLPWTAEILGDESIAEPTDRIDHLYARAMAYLDRVIGPEKVFPIPVYLRAKRLTWEKIQSRFAGDLLQNGSAFCAELWPEKHNEMGPDLVQALIGDAETLARTRRITALPDVGVYAAFMFILGHEFCKDPL